MLPCYDAENSEMIIDIGCSNKITDSGDSMMISTVFKREQNGAAKPQA